MAFVCFIFRTPELFGFHFYKSKQKLFLSLKKPILKATRGKAPINRMHLKPDTAIAFCFSFRSNLGTWQFLYIRNVAGNASLSSFR